MKSYLAPFNATENTKNTASLFLYICTKYIFHFYTLFLE